MSDASVVQIQNALNKFTNKKINDQEVSKILEIFQGYLKGSSVLGNKSRLDGYSEFANKILDK